MTVTDAATREIQGGTDEMSIRRERMCGVLGGVTRIYMCGVDTWTWTSTRCHPRIHGPGLVRGVTHVYMSRRCYPHLHVSGPVRGVTHVYMDLDQ